MAVAKNVTFRSLVPKKNKHLYAQAKAEHIICFSKWVAALHGYTLVGDDEFMFTFHVRRTSRASRWRSQTRTGMCVCAGVCAHAMLACARACGAMRACARARAVWAADCARARACRLCVCVCARGLCILVFACVCVCRVHARCMCVRVRARAAWDALVPSCRAPARIPWLPQAAVTQFRTFLPANRANTITLNLVAWLIMALKQAFTFTKDANDDDVKGMMRLGCSSTAFAPYQRRPCTACGRRRPVKILHGVNVR